ncbi:non-ribosomal peptide synthetase [Vibrio mimicus]|uniref:non-ribosomal peptide synthetase n=1 Tax=Vibrio mimicus TaxID=674 RepID=UPI000510AE2F|nr:non-ribosomal peptide synthetase [Vibrio mimicus]
MSFQNELLSTLREAICQSLSIPIHGLNDTDNLFELGLDSMFMMRMVNQFRRAGCKVTLKEIYQNPTLAQVDQLIESKLTTSTALSTPSPRFQSFPTMKDGVPFAMTPVQLAYYIGRGEQQVLGGNGCHLYQEFNTLGLEASSLEEAINVLIHRHPMLNVAFQSDGTQRWVEPVRKHRLPLHDLRHLSEEDANQAMLALRDQLSHQVLDVHNGQTFDIQMALLNEGHSRVYVSIDLLVMDASSFSLFFNELSLLLQGKTLPQQQSDYDFRSYLLQEQEEFNTQRKAASLFWQEQYERLPAAPNLPLVQDPAQLKKPTFHRRRYPLTPAQWQQFQSLASSNQVTPTMVLATLFAAVLSRWCGQRQLLLNLTLFDCHPFNPHMNEMLADFTNILLLDVEINEASVLELIQAHQQRFAELYEHRIVSGVEVLRDLKKNGSHPHGAPIVFTSNLNRSLFGDDADSPLGEPGWGISQTPQVWLDFVAFKQGNGIVLQWDGIDALFPTDFVDTMFDAFTQLVEYLLQDQSVWHSPLPDLLPEKQKQVREQRNHTHEELPQGLLHDRIFEQAQTNPNNTALISADQTLSFNEVATKAKQLAQSLIEAGMHSGEHVAVSMEKGLGQVIAVLAILHAGGVYVPIAPNQPLSRRQTIIENANIRIVVRCKTAKEKFEWTSSTHIDWQETSNTRLDYSPHSRSPKDTAYIIYTSGSTGTPKGVVISHQSALNTCLDINQRHGISHRDRVLAISALHFDLSVYDIFGVLAAGGALVLPQEVQSRDPMAWSGLIAEHQVTIWNSVPALFDMFLTFCEGMKLTTPLQLRAVMLSGDWIDLSLPTRYRAFQPLGTFSAMGGATEAAIWSNEYLVNHVDPHWRSIPYGYPLKNQCYRVVDDAGQDCPDWVPGELWIGGIGVAQGYWNDEARTLAQFVETTCPQTHKMQRWYRTGDTGCYWPDGTLEFLGRKDNQVKVGGYRIELGEIDAALNRVQGVRHGVALATSLSGGRDKQLECFVVVEGNTLCSEVKPDPSLPQDYAALFSDIESATAPQVTSLIAHFLHQHLTAYLPENNQPKPLAIFAQQYGVSARYFDLFEQWWHFLCAQGYAEKHTQNTGESYRLLPLTSESEVTTHPWQSFLYCSDLLHNVLSEQTTAQALLESDLSPEVMLMKEPAFQTLLAQIIKAISTLSDKFNRPIQLVEIEARSALLAQQVCSLLGPEKVQYRALDSSFSLVQQAEKRLKRLSHAQAQHASIAYMTPLIGQADILILNNVLHRQNDPARTLKQVIDILKPQGMLLVSELATLPEAALISAQVLEQQSPSLLSSGELDSAFKQANLGLQHTVCMEEHRLYVLKNHNAHIKPDSDKLSAKLSTLLPPYMVPKRFTFMEALPLTPNGKVDRKALSDATLATSPRSLPHKPVLTEKEKVLARVWQTLFNHSDLDVESDFFLLGGDSLLATRCIGALQHQGYHADLTQLFSSPTLGQFAATLTMVEPDEPTSLTPLVAKPTHRYLPFPMTEVQQAYWVGRQSGFALGDTSSQFFIEFRVEQLEVERFNQAMNRLIQRHDMLRAVVRDHHQQVLISVPSFSLTCHVLDDLEGSQANAIRDGLSHQVKNPALWPLFSVEAITHTSGEARIFINLDNMMLDGLSMQIFFAELEELYQDPSRTLPVLEITFRDFVEWQQQAETKQDLSAAKAYWQQRLTHLPSAPNLPIQADPATISKPKFIRAAGSLSPKEWQALKAIAARHQVTPSVVLMNAYACTLSAWSNHQALTLNLTLFDRPDVHPNIQQIMGDFTTLLLLAWHPEYDWMASLKRLQNQLANDLPHSQISAVWVMRELARQQQQASTIMPVVFTSALGTSEGDFLSNSGWLKPTWGISQTPQIWLDHQVYESSGHLCLNWDAVEALLPQPLLNQIFEQYLSLLKTLATQPESWTMSINQLLPIQRTETRFIPAQASSVDREPIRSRDDGDPATIEKIQQAFKQIVNSAIGEKENFFDAGANSLQLVQLHAALHQMSMPLSVTDLFTYPSPALLAAFLSEGRLSDKPSDDQLARRQRQNDRKLNRRQRVQS